MPASSSNKKGNDILSGCEDLLNDFSLPEEHTDLVRFVSIDRSKVGANDSITSSPTATPGSTARGGTTNSDSDAVNLKEAAKKRAKESSVLAKSELARSKKAWGTAIDRYVASVLEDEEDGKGLIVGSPGSKSAKSSGGSKKSKKKSDRSHRDNYLLAALQNDGASVSSSHASVDIDGHIDDSSFAPINPFGPTPGCDHTKNTNNKGDPNYSRKEQIKEYVKEEWKPISLIALVILVTIIVSATAGASSGGKREGDTNPDTPDFVFDMGEILSSGSTVPVPTSIPTESPSTPSPTAGPIESSTAVPTEYPTYVPTGFPSIKVVTTESPIVAIVTESPFTPVVVVTEPPVAAIVATPAPTTKEPTKNPTPQPTTHKPTSNPTLTPTSSPTHSNPTTSPSLPPVMPLEYYEMKKAAEYVSSNSPDASLSNTASPQSLAFHWLYYEGNPSTNLYEFFEQYATAVVFFSLTQARTSYAYVNSGQVYSEWTERKEVCGWEGVRCAFNYTSEMVHVTEIHLSGKKLVGSIPEEIEFLPYVNKLDLSDNEVEGTVPESVYGLSRLRHLFLNNNKLTGTISSSLDDLHLAEQIYLGQNSFTGTLPSNIGTNRANNWRFFSIHDNHLTGTIPEGMKLKNAYMLDFSRNDFYGTIPNDVQHENYSTLRLLYMDHNSLTGTIPGSLMQMRKLKGLFLNDNRLEGMIPYQIDEAQMVGMLTIRVQNNRLSQPVAPVICGMDVNMGEYELVELGVDCEICPSDCSLCTGRCY